MKIKRFNENIELDPYNEENWDEDEKLEKRKKELVKRCASDMIDNSTEYRYMLYDILKNYFNNQSIEEMENFLGETEIDCEECRGTGEIEGETCENCEGCGKVPGYY